MVASHPTHGGEVAPDQNLPIGLHCRTDDTKGQTRIEASFNLARCGEDRESHKCAQEQDDHMRRVAKKRFQAESCVGLSFLTKCLYNGVRGKSQNSNSANRIGIRRPVTAFSRRHVAVGVLARVGPAPGCWTRLCPADKLGIEQKSL